MVIEVAKNNASNINVNVKYQMSQILIGNDKL